MLMFPIFNFAEAYTNDPSVPAGRVIGVTGMHVTGPPTALCTIKTKKNRKQHEDRFIGAGGLVTTLRVGLFQCSCVGLFYI